MGKILVLWEINGKIHGKSSVHDDFNGTSWENHCFFGGDLRDFND